MLPFFKITPMLKLSKQPLARTSCLRPITVAKSLGEMPKNSIPYKEKYSNLFTFSAQVHPFPFCSPLLFTILLVLCLSLMGCGPILPLTPIDVVPTVAHIGYATAQDQRDMGDIISDKDLTMRLKQELMDTRAKDGYFLNIYVFNGKVFLIGDPPQDFQEAAVRFPMQQDGVASLDYCFFPHNSGNAFNDFLISVSLRSNLIFEQGISSTWVEAEVYASTAVLLGVVPSNDAIEHIKAVAWNTQGVNNVISFMLLDDSS